MQNIVKCDLCNKVSPMVPGSDRHNGDYYTNPKGWQSFKWLVRRAGRVDICDECIVKIDKLLNTKLNK